MADTDVSPAAGAATLPGFRLVPLPASPDPCWFRGSAEGGGGPLLVRRIDGIPFAVAVRELAAAIDLFDSCPAGMSAPLAFAASRGGRIVAGSAAATSGLEITVDAAAAAAVAADAAVDVWTFYRDEGGEVLADAAADPRAAGERLAAVAEVIDRLAVGHGSIDSPALRLGPTGPLVLGFGLSALEAVRRERLDQPGPWLSLAPERCLPPGLATAAGDQYALAALWTAARTGHPPHAGDTAAAIVRSKLSDPPALDGLDTAEREVAARALATRAEERFGSCAAFAAALRGTLDGVQEAVPLQAPVATEPAPPPHHVRPASDPTRFDDDASVPLPISDPDPVTEQVVMPTEPDPGPPPTVAAGLPGTGLASLLAAAPYKPGDLILPGHRLERLLGKGGFGEVWKAVAPGGMSVAIKVIGNLGRKEGAREFRALRTVKNVHHAYIVPIFGVWLKTAAGRLLDEDEASRAGDRILQGHESAIRRTVAPGDGDALASLELIVAMGLGDRTLYDELRSRDADARSGIEPGQLLEWMRQAALAIDHFNRGSVRDGTTTAAVQHCDIKPQNMLLVGNVVQVCDFGLARVQGQARATANNLVSIAYAAPEMMVKPFNPSPTTDQYSLAVSYYELRTGRLPYGDQAESPAEEISPVELMRAKTDGAVELGHVPPLERRVLLRALALDPVDRFGSCEELVDMLESAVEMDRTPRRPAPAFPWVRAGVLTGGAVLATVLAAGMLLGPKIQPVQEPPPERYFPQAKAALNDAVTREGIDRGLVERAADLAREAGAAGEEPEACQAVAAAAQAVLRALAAIAAIRDDGTNIAGLAEAEAAVGALPDSVPDPLRMALEQDLGTRTQDVRAGVARKLVARAVARLDDDALRSSETPIEGKKRALDDSVTDLEAALDLDPGSWLAHDRLGLCESLRGRHSQAIEAFDVALGLLAKQGGPDDKERRQVLGRRAYAFAETKRYGDAADDYVATAGNAQEVCSLLWKLKNRAWEATLFLDAAKILDHLHRLLSEQPDCCPPEIDPLQVRADRAWLLACGFGVDPAGRAVPEAKALVDRVGMALEAADESGKKSLEPTRLNALDTLACAHARAGDFAAALRTIDEVLAVVPVEAFLKHREKFARQEAWDQP